MFGDHFYNATIRKIVTVFGTLFNDIKIVRTSNGEVQQIKRVPLAYGPRDKFLTRISQMPNFEETKIGIKLPRMSFEMTSIEYDSLQKLPKMNQLTQASDDPTIKKSIYTYTPYKIGMQLNILTNNQDDALQVVEQILPFFQPEFTVTINDQEDFGIKSDVPVVLNGVSFSEEYEGDFMARRAIIYTLDFTMNAKFYGPVTDRSIIREVNIDINDAQTLGFYEEYNAEVNPSDAGPDDEYTIDEGWDTIDNDEQD